ncbi:MAG: hypothetical protein JWM39_814 [Parcubacteria group bacterium]|nr:hypothetical protein [Parcubacteria group bacterium]
MTLPRLSRTIALVLMVTLVGSSFAGAFPRSAYADDGGSDAGGAPAISAPASDPAPAATDSAPATTDPSPPANTIAADTSATDTPAANTEIAASTASSTPGTSPVDTAVVTVDSGAPSVPSAPSGDSIATTSSTEAANTVSTIASTTQRIVDTIASSTGTTTTPIIQSGEAVAVANILNIVNTNIVNSQGAVVLGNYFNTATSTIDLRSSNPFGALACDLLSCDSGGITVNVGSNASIDNAVALSADSGGNNITSNTNGVINTGNAFAGLNLINLANMNIIDSNYLLVTLNAFQGINGDIVFPSLTNFLSSLAQGGNGGSFSADSTANVQNNITTNADSGSNSTDAASSTIATGSAQSSGSVFNRINAASIGGGNVSILFRVQGNWAGQIFDAPAGLNWTRGADGSILLFGDPGSTGTGADLSNTNITGSTTAHINNNVSVTALTGDNHADVAGSALITTGNALASANVVNVANTNVVGKNWILAVVNIFGDFNGNIAFGRPDLWVGEQVSTPSFIQNGSQVTYKYSVINNGDSNASDATLTDTQDLAHLDISNPSVPYTTDANGHLVWQLGAIPAGRAVEVTYQATVKDSPPGTAITNSVTVGEHETDNNTVDNTDTATINASEPSFSSLSSASFANDLDLHIKDNNLTTAVPDLSNITVERGAATTTISRGHQAHETLTVRNGGSAASPALTLHDIMRDPSGTMIQDQSGSIGVLQPGDAVTIGYDLAFADDAPAGTYALTTVLSAGDMSAAANDNGTLILQGAATGAKGSATKSGTKFDSVGSIAATVAGSLTTKVAHASDGSLAAGAGFAGISWQLGLILFVLIALALGLGTTALRMRRTRSS